MKKFSIVIPVYNQEKYVEKCLKSVFTQSFKDYEVIVVNDGSTDKSETIIKAMKMPVKYFKTSNQGLSEARNYGIKQSIGEYIIFLDSDDYIEKDLLLNLSIINDDVVRYQIQRVEMNGEIKALVEEPFYSITGPEAFEKLVNYKIVESAGAYAVKRKYWLKNKFEFAKGKYHEDFGLMPMVIMKAASISSIEYIGYNYVQHQNSIMHGANELKKANDVFDHYFMLLKFINELKCDNDYKLTFRSYISNSTIEKSLLLRDNDKEEYISKLKQYKVCDNLLANTFKRKIKRLLAKTNIKLYLRVIKCQK